MMIAHQELVSLRRPRAIPRIYFLPFRTLLWLLSHPIPIVPFFLGRVSSAGGAYVCCLVVVSFAMVLGAKSNTRPQGSKGR
jgi:hypothetical protein